MQKYLKKGRVILALLFFGTLLVAFSDIKGMLPPTFYKSVLYLQFIPSVLKFLTAGTILSIGFIAVLFITFLCGRVYCSVICPLGILQDVLIFLKRKLALKQKRRFKKAYNAFRYGVLAVAILSLLIGGVLSLNILDPYANFGRIGSHLIQPLTVELNNIFANNLSFLGLHSYESRPIHILSFFFAFGILLLLSIMTWIQGRLYCNTICPVGTLLGILSRISIFKIKINNSSCTQCGKCQTACKAHCINIKTMTVDESRCVNCFNCIPVCDDNSIGYKIKKKVDSVEIASKLKGRRFFLAATAGYVATRVVSLNAQHNRSRGMGGKNNNKIRYYERGTIAPPGAISVAHLKDRCVACHLCVSSCPTKVLQPSYLDYGLTGLMVPKMDYGVNFCNYDCTKCGEVCPTGAIIHLPADEKRITQIGKVELRLRHCIVESEGTACGSCSEHCPTQAVKMVPYEDELTIPEIDQSICIGCGACEYACPVTDPHPAIFVASNKEHLFADKPTTEKVEFEDTEEFPF